MSDYDIDTVYQKYKSFDKKQRADVISALRGQGIMLMCIEPYAYPEAEGIRHLFIIL